MDITELAARLAEILGPLWPVVLPILLKGGEEAWKEFAKVYGKKFGEESLELAQRFFGKLFDKIKAKHAALEAAKDAADTPDDPDTQATIRQQLKKILSEEPELKIEAEVVVEQITNISYGDRNVMIDKAEKSQIATGDGVTLVGRDFMQNIYPAQPAATDPASLRSAYLSHVFDITSQLQLSGIDPKTASDAEARLSLSAVYTALLTLSPEDQEAFEKTRRTDVERLMEHGARRASALEQLNRHKRLVLLGDPGSGKSTFVNFVAMCLSGEAFKHKDANLEALTAPLPAEEDKPRLRREKEDKPQPQPWEHGVLLPIRVILRDFAARGLPPIGEKASAKTLWDFIAAELDAWALRDFEKPLVQELLNSGGLLFLDGLDEVPEADQRRAQIKQAVEDFAATFQKCRILVTSRTYAYQKQDWRLKDFSESVLAPFSPGQIRNFIERWYIHIAVLRNMNEQDARGRAELLKRAIFNSDRLMGLAERPLLLTLMASLHAWRGGSLPEKREELYADAVDLLLDWWESPKVVRNARGEMVVRQPSLAEWLEVDRQRVRTLLEELAFKAHAMQTELTGTADIPESDLVGGLLHLSQNPEVNPRKLVEYLSLRAGLLIPRGIGVFTFPHRTFQEYLAACHLTDHDYPEKVAELACNDFNRWREVALLASAKAARGTASAIWSMVDALCFSDPVADSPEKHYWGAHLAGQALVESSSYNNVSERNIPKKERVVEWLVSVLETDYLPAIERAAAGDTLARLGDPRPGVNAGGFLWCPIPKGEFLMGTKSKKDDPFSYDYEYPQFPYPIRETYYISRYPITNAQFDAFVNDPDGYQRKDWWTKDGLKSRGDRTGPEKQGGIFDLPNHPVVNVSWYEAHAFTRWLTNSLQARGFTLKTWKDGKIEEMPMKTGKWEVRLPTEAEWERAARGPHGWRYPWGDEPDPNCANYADTGIGATSVVGCFPAGQNPWGLLDMSGNVWEWCATQWTDDYQGYLKKENNSPEGDIPRVVRGGAFSVSGRYVRCAARNWHGPRFWLRYLGFRVVVSPVL